MQSSKFNLNEADVKQWAHNALIFAGPALLVLLASIERIVPSGASNGVIVLYILNTTVDLLRKFLAGQN